MLDIHKYYGADAETFKRVYQTKVTDITDLKQRLIDVWAGMGKTSRSNNGEDPSGLHWS